MFILIMNQLIKMLFIMILAFICYRLHIINQEGNRNFSNLLLMVVNPCLIITVFQTDYDPGLVRGLLACLREELAQYDAYYLGDTAQKVIYLTFDCGYENGCTEKILDALKKHRAPAAFFGSVTTGIKRWGTPL